MLFKDVFLQKQFDAKGYVILDFFKLEEIEKLQMIYLENPSNKKASFQVSIYQNDIEYNKLIDNKIKQIFKPIIQQYFQNYKLLQGLFYIKFPEKNSNFYTHKDWSLVDESQFTSLHIWAPLTDTDNQNGNLFICPSDYKKRITYRGSPGFEFPKPTLFERIRNKLIYNNIYLKKGQVICFDHKLTHGSHSNRSKNVRIAAGISIIPQNAPLIHYHLKNQNIIQKYTLSEDFYIDFNLKEMNYKYQSNKIEEIYVD